jgi:hypothetical protein
MAGDATPAQGNEVMGVDIATQDERWWPSSSKILGSLKLRLDIKTTGW